ncbi:MAG TPA: EAL domain-containing protein [Burkholderiales bacterium]|nr:EAL domain-containing protein [Betaproteobacteria bacterium]HQR52424.1 EAL domain-containing protein [Burkholderiales bacterium]
MSATPTPAPVLWRHQLAPSLLVAVLTLLWAASGALHRIDLVLYDGLLAVNRVPASADIALVQIDERSLQQLGRWPWPRARHAELIDRLRERGARAVALQIIFAEAGDAEDDRRLADAIARFGAVVLPVFPELDPGVGGLHARTSVPSVAEMAAQGHVDAELDQDGVVRSVYLRAGLNQPTWPHLGLALLEAAGEPPDSLPGERLPGASLSRSGLWLRDHRALVAFAAGPFAAFSYADVLRGAVPDASLRDKLVLVGVTATGLRDSLPTPVVQRGAPMSGLEFNANVVNALRQHRLIEPMSTGVAVALSMLIAPLPLLVRWRVRTSLLPAALAVAAAVGAVLLSAALLRWANLWFPPTAAAVGALTAYPLWSWLQIRSTANELAREREELNATLQAIGDAVIATDRAGRVVYLNPAAEALTGLSAAQANERPLEDLLRLEDEHGRLRLPVQEVLAPGGHDQVGSGLRGRLTAESGETRSVRVSGRPIRNARGVIDGAVLAVTDLSDIVAMTERIEYQATHDALTGLPNRLLLRDRLVQALAHARRSRSPVAVLFIDLDRFKHVNDSLGHSEGDVLLQKVSQRLRTAVREGDTVARWGGDEFVVVLDSANDGAAAQAVAHKIAAALRSPIPLGLHVVTISASIGGAIYPDDGDTSETLLRRADAAMYRAKSSGRDAVRFFAQEMDEAAAERLALELALREAIDHGQLELVYQPQVRLRDGKLVGAEALVRWRHPTAGLLGPARFIGLAEDSGLIIGLGNWVLREACSQLRTWRRAGLPPLAVSVNVSPRQFAHAEFENTVTGALDSAGIVPGDLKLEITESVLATDLERTAAVMRRLQERGVGVSIDDFGVDYSALRYLKQFPVGELKIDHAFVSHVTSSPQDAAITEAIIALARSLGLSVVAEGVETLAQLDFLRERGCDAAQGFVLSRPLPVAEMTRLLERGGALSLSVPVAPTFPAARSSLS